jgi:hypothetical protein
MAFSIQKAFFDRIRGLTGWGVWIMDFECWMVDWRRNRCGEWLVKEAGLILDFEFWLNGASRLNLRAARRSAPTL